MKNYQLKYNNLVERFWIHQGNTSYVDSLYPLGSQTEEKYFLISHQQKNLQRFYSQLEFANQLLGLHKDKTSEWQDRIISAGELVRKGLQKKTIDVEDLVLQGEEQLGTISSTAKEYKLLCISHAHIDMNWQWSWPETVSVTNDTFTTMLNLLDEYPDFIFSQSQASVYRLIEKYNPEMFLKIKNRVHEGRWEVTASQWVEGDKNMSNGESITRHMLYTRSYFHEKFGLGSDDITLDFEPDTFGHPATLPAILTKGGIRYYYHCRGSRGPFLYWWIGQDGSRLLSLNGMPWYQTIALSNRKQQLHPKIVEPLIEFMRATGLKILPVLYGVGNHGGGPTRQDIELLLDMNKWPVYPKVEFSSLHNFFRLAERDAKIVPEISGERNFVFTGCYTSQARLKLANRQGENLLYIAESAAAISTRLAGTSYPKGNLTDAWEMILFSQFHDILTGSGVPETVQYSLGKAQESQALGGMARTNALRKLSEKINSESLLLQLNRGKNEFLNTSSLPPSSQGAGVGFATGYGGESQFSISNTAEKAFLIFNPLAHSRSEIIEIKLWDIEFDLNQMVVITEGDPPCPVQILDQGVYWGHTYVSVCFPVNLPALGYRTVCLSDSLFQFLKTEQKNKNYWIAQNEGYTRTKVLEKAILENELVKVTIDSPSSGITSLIDKRTGREWVPQEKKLGIFQYILEENIGGRLGSAWELGEFIKKEDLLEGGKLKKVHEGDYIQSFRWKRSIGKNSMLELDISLRKNSSRLEYRLKVDWREMGDKELIPHLRVSFPFEITKPNARYEIPYGSIIRKMNCGEEIVAQRWADLSEKDGQGVVIINSSKYGYSLEKETINLTLLRSTTTPDPLPDMGEHIIEYALHFHKEGWSVGNSMAVGEEFNIPLVSLNCGFQKGILPSFKSLVELENKNVRLVSLKMSEDSKKIIIRLVETEGKKTIANISISSELFDTTLEAVCVNSLEQPLKNNTTQIKNGKLHVEIPAYGIVTVSLS